MKSKTYRGLALRLVDLSYGQGWRKHVDFRPATGIMAPRPAAWNCALIYIKEFGRREEESWGQT